MSFCFRYRWVCFSSPPSHPTPLSLLPPLHLSIQSLQRPAVRFAFSFSRGFRSTVGPRLFAASSGVKTAGPPPHLGPPPSSWSPTAISPPDHCSIYLNDENDFFLQYFMYFFFGLLYFAPERRRHNKGWKQGNQGDEEPGGSERINQARNQ